MENRFDPVRSVALLLTIALCVACGYVLISEVKQSYLEQAGITEEVCVVDGGTVIIDGQENHLYPVFNSQAAALRDIKEQVPELLETLSKTYWLAPLSNRNWEDYRGAMWQLFEDERCPEDYTEANPDFQALNVFFDIYENAEKNEKILAYLDSAGEDGLSEQELMSLLPYTTPYVEERMPGSNEA